MARFSHRRPLAVAKQRPAVPARRPRGLCHLSCGACRCGRCLSVDTGRRRRRIVAGIRDAASSSSPRAAWAPSRRPPRGAAGSAALIGLMVVALPRPRPSAHPVARRTGPDPRTVTGRRRRGDGLARRHATTASPSGSGAFATPGGSATSTEATDPPSDATAEPKRYRVKSGDTLSSIAARIRHDRQEVEGRERRSRTRARSRWARCWSSPFAERASVLAAAAIGRREFPRRHLGDLRAAPRTGLLPPLLWTARKSRTCVSNVGGTRSRRIFDRGAPRVCSRRRVESVDLLRRKGRPLAEWKQCRAAWRDFVAVGVAQPGDECLVLHEVLELTRVAAGSARATRRGSRAGYMPHRVRSPPAPGPEQAARTPAGSR